MYVNTQFLSFVVVLYTIELWHENDNNSPSASGLYSKKNLLFLNDFKVYLNNSQKINFKSYKEWDKQRLEGIASRIEETLAVMKDIISEE
jgi:hypothetical protein